jgi:hypothetical protein
MRPLLGKKGADLFVCYVAGAEFFDLLPRRVQEKVFPEMTEGSLRRLARS